MMVVCGVWSVVHYGFLSGSLFTSSFVICFLGICASRILSSRRRPRVWTVMWTVCGHRYLLVRYGGLDQPSARGRGKVAPDMRKSLFTVQKRFLSDTQTQSLFLEAASGWRRPAGRKS